MKIELTQADNGKNITVKAGDTIVLSLPENPTTGYRWSIDKSESEILLLQSSVFALPHESGIGAGGVRHWTFIAKDVGIIRLELKLWRDWEGEASVSERFALTCDITD